ncbi:MAG: hypothetical protein JEZ07_03440 [Phycisphaerae bacterium]|nr:hypothetical protein [Phycisphaerae bacterium]
MNNKRANRKNRKFKKNRIRNARLSDWIEPESKDCVIYVGSNSKGDVANSNIIKKQIEFLESKKSSLWRNGKLIEISDIMIAAREPISLEQHRAEYTASVIPQLSSDGIHPEVLKNNLQELYLQEINKIPLFEHIRLDRKMRKDKNTSMADRPPFAVVTIKDECIVRLEFYKGHDNLYKHLDLRCPTFSEKKIPDTFVDENGYDVIENEYWTALLFGIKVKDFKNIVDYAHEALLCDYCKFSFEDHSIQG